MDPFHDITTPTLLIDRQRAMANIAFMTEKARQQKIRFRPHFKTHQSAQIGEWFRTAGVEAITVSSLEMAAYFARHGWADILVAFTVNLRQLAVINELAVRIRLGLLLESIESLEALGRGLNAPIDAWIKIDSGSGRTGILWQDGEQVMAVIEAARRMPNLRLRGLLTHAGATYRQGSAAEVVRCYQESNLRMNELRARLEEANLPGLEVSVGDTPGCTLSPDLGRVDEIRPGNFVYYDAQMLRLGVCDESRVAAVLACPVVALHPPRNEVVVYGGAVHLSKDSLELDGKVWYGQVVELREQGWSSRIPRAGVERLSQEHGILHIPAPDFERFQVGGLAGIIPAHVCLAVSTPLACRTLDGETIQTLARATG